MKWRYVSLAGQKSSTTSIPGSGGNDGNGASYRRISDGPGGAPRRRRLVAIGGAAVAVVVVVVAFVTIVVAHGGSPSNGPALDAWTARTVTDVNGETRISDRPSRIVALGPGDAELVHALGFTVVGGGNGSKPELPSWVPGLKDVPSTGTATSPNLSAIKDLKPDLIIDTDPAGALTARGLKSVASSIAVPHAGRRGWTWQEQVLFIADALGARERAADVRRKYEQKVTELRIAHPELTGKKIDLLHYDGRSVFLATNSTNAFQLFSQLGFAMQVPSKETGSAWLAVTADDVSTAVSSRSVDVAIIARTDQISGGAIHEGLPSSLTYGAPIVVIDSSCGADALLFGGPLAVDTIASAIIPTGVSITASRCR